MSIASFPLSDVPISGQIPSEGAKKPAERAPSNRLVVAKSDPVVRPEPR